MQHFVKCTKCGIDMPKRPGPGRPKLFCQYCAEEIDADRADQYYEVQKERVFTRVKRCTYCGQEFRGWGKKFCNSSCAQKSRVEKPLEFTDCNICHKASVLIGSPTGAGRQTYKVCSDECFSRSKATRKSAPWHCSECGKLIERERERKFCSLGCMSKARRKRICKGCGKVFIPSKGFKEYCSQSCQDSVPKRPICYDTKICENCGKSFTFPAWENARHRKKGRRFCSPECSQLWLKDNTVRVGGKKKKNRKGGPKAAVRFEVFRQHGFRCFYCGRGARHGVALVLEHVNPVAKNGKDDPRNYVPACEECNVGKGTKLVKDAKRLDRVIEEQLFLI